jgi:hypothetical protein
MENLRCDAIKPIEAGFRTFPFAIRRFPAFICSPALLIFAP